MRRSPNYGQNVDPRLELGLLQLPFLVLDLLDTVAIAGSIGESFDTWSTVAIRVALWLSATVALLPRILFFVGGCSRERFVGNGGLGCILILSLCECLSMILLDAPFWVYSFTTTTSSATIHSGGDTTSTALSLPAYFWIVHPLRVIMGCIPCYLISYRELMTRREEECEEELLVLQQSCRE